MEKKKPLSDMHLFRETRPSEVWSESAIWRGRTCVTFNTARIYIEWRQIKKIKSI